VYDVFGLKNGAKVYLDGKGQKVCLVTGKIATQKPELVCDGSAGNSNTPLPRSCLDAKTRCVDGLGRSIAKDGTYYVKDGAKKQVRVTCDMRGGGWQKINTAYLQGVAQRSHNCNVAYSFNWECSGFYSYPNSYDYELWNNFDLHVGYTKIKGKFKNTGQCGSVGNGCSTSGSNPDPGWYNFKSDTKYAQLGAGGQGSGNKAWYRWGKPGQMMAPSGRDMIANGRGGHGTHTVTVKEQKVVAGSVLRFSSSSESGARPCERFMYHDFDLYVQ